MGGLVEGNFSFSTSCHFSTAFLSTCSSLELAFPRNFEFEHSLIYFLPLNEITKCVSSVLKKSRSLATWLIFPTLVSTSDIIALSFGFASTIIAIITVFVTRRNAPLQSPYSPFPMRYTSKKADKGSGFSSGRPREETSDS
jgi:hypothetical protein